jgi:hypothetical protein
VQLSEQAEQPKKVKKGAIPEWAEGLYYNKGIFSLDFSHSRRVANCVG